MIEKKVIKNFYGKLLGTIETDTVAKKRKAKDFYGRLLGTYDPREDTTKNYYGRLISRGDSLEALVYNSGQNYRKTESKQKQENNKKDVDK